MNIKKMLIRKSLVIVIGFITAFIGNVSSGSDEDSSDDWDTVSTSLLPDRDNCGLQDADRIVGGTVTEFTEFPWLAMLMYKDANGQLDFLCGGTLISNKYVLTAAHCVTGNILQHKTVLESVKLGEWDVNTLEDCIDMQGFKDCNDAPVLINVEVAIPHPDYNDQSKNVLHDIALVRMKRPAEFTTFIKPICLPLGTETLTAGEELVVSGWGRTETAYESPIKLKLVVPYFSFENCLETYQSANFTITKNQLCAGGEKGKDSCTGDSGGPLMQKSKKGRELWTVQGVISYGVGKCGTENWPGVYTRVSEYLEWIRENVRA